MTGDENSIYYSNPKRRVVGLLGHASTSSTRPNIHTAKVMLCIWWTRLVLFIISCWNRTKLLLGNGIERNWCVWAEHCAKNGHNTSRGTKKWFYSMTTLGLTVPTPLKPTWKRSNGNFYLTRRTPQILRRPIIACSGRWHNLGIEINFLEKTEWLNVREWLWSKRKD